jgi:hypothetical protein
MRYNRAPAKANGAAQQIISCCKTSDYRTKYKIVTVKNVVWVATKSFLVATGRVLVATGRVLVATKIAIIIDRMV